jgi:hypothetical protein
MSDVETTQERPVAPETQPAARPPRNGRLKRWAKRLGSQTSRLILLVAIVGVSGVALGYALGYPLRYVDYEASSAIALDQASLAGTIEPTEALVSAEDLGPAWASGDTALGEVIETPTPLSPREAAVWVDGTNGARIISQALRVDRWKAAEEYVSDVAAGLEECDTYFREVEGEQVKVTSTDLDRDPPVTDHVDRRYQSPEGVQDWSMMAVGDVIVAIQYLAATPPPDGLLRELEDEVLRRIAPGEFSVGGIDPATLDPAVDPALTTTSTTAPGG